MHYQHITIRKPKNTIGRRHYCILIQKMHSLQICTKGTIFFVSTNDRKRALVDYVIFHVNICHILNKFKHNFYYFFVEKYMHSEQCRLYSYTSCCCLFQQPHAERVSRRKTPAETCQFRMKK